MGLKGVGHSSTEGAWVTLLNVEFILVVRRLVAEKEASNGIALIEQVAAPEQDLPSSFFVANSGVEEVVGIAPLIIAIIKIEGIPTRLLDSGEEAPTEIDPRPHRVLPRGGDGERATVEVVSLWGYAREV